MTSPDTPPPLPPGPLRGHYPAELERTWTPAGRAAVLIRPLRADDLDRELAFVEGLSRETLYLRVQYHGGQPTRHDVERLLDLDYVDRLAVAGLVEQDGAARIVGVSRYARIDETRRAECAVVVADDWQGCGLGTELMRTLIVAACERGYACLEGVALAENSRLVAWARRFGFNVRTEPNSGGLLRVSIELDHLLPVDDLAGGSST